MIFQRRYVEDGAYAHLRRVEDGRKFGLLCGTASHSGLLGAEPAETAQADSMALCPRCEQAMENLLEETA